MNENKIEKEDTTKLFLFLLKHIYSRFKVQSKQTFLPKNIVVEALLPTC